jgi:hypothetical protein
MRFEGTWPRWSKYLARTVHDPTSSQRTRASGYERFGVCPIRSGRHSRHKSRSIRSGLQPNWESSETRFSQLFYPSAVPAELPLADFLSARPPTSCRLASAQQEANTTQSRAARKPRDDDFRRIGGPQLRGLTPVMPWLLLAQQSVPKRSDPHLARRRCSTSLKPYLSLVPDRSGIALAHRPRNTPKCSLHFEDFRKLVLDFPID